MTSTVMRNRNLPVTVGVTVELTGEAAFEVPDTGVTIVQVRMGAGQVIFYSGGGLKGGRFAVRAAADSSEALVSVAAGVAHAFSRGKPGDGLPVHDGAFASILPTAKPELTTGEGYPVPPEPTLPPAPAPAPPDHEQPPAAPDDRP